MLVSREWKDYILLDAGNGEKLESWNGIVLRRPDPQAIWNAENTGLWNKPDGYYHRSGEGGGYWEFNKKLKESWIVSYKDLTFKVSPTNFKHTGLFPEQAVNWDFMMNKIKQSKRDIKVLNLFAYTGGATVACSKAGAKEVVHVDASKGMTEWAKENMKLSEIADNKVRFLVDDCFKFVEREIRRGNKYDAIIMDPPSYGRGPNKELWKFENDITKFINETIKLLSDKPLFLLINSYTTGISSVVLENILKSIDLPKGTISSGEVGLPISDTHLILPCGIYAKWEE